VRACTIACVWDSKSMSDTWIECKGSESCGVGGGEGCDVSLRCDYSFKIGKDVSRRERMQHLNSLFSAMVEQVDDAFGEVWVGGSTRLEENEGESCSPPGI
jgi:hypothetical protein